MRPLQPFTVKVTFLFASLIAVGTVIMRALMPFNHDEVATFFHYVQNGEIYPFFSEIDANNHFLNTFLTRIFFLLFGDHPFVLRLANVLSVFVLILAVYRFCKLLKTAPAKLTLMGFFLLSFYWLSFFAYCRGYGISMAFFILGLSYLVSLIKDSSRRSFLLMVVALQLALAANLILIVPVAMITAIVVMQQFISKNLFKKDVLLIHVVNALLICFWLAYSMYLKKNGALYYGAGDSYWKVTFLTLSDILTNIRGPVVLYSFIALLIFLAWETIRKFKNNERQETLIFLSLLSLHVLAFFLMKVFMEVNYPEDRTGLFYFVFAVLFIVFAIDDLGGNRVAGSIAFVSTVLITVHLIFNWNIQKSNVPNYELMPERFYQRLVEEQKRQKENITIGGYRMKALIYAFMNYRNGGPLGLLDPVESMNAYTDYYIGDKRDSVFFSRYYDVIERENNHGYRLLKRKNKLDREVFLHSDTVKSFEGSEEYFNFFERTPFQFEKSFPVLAELDLEIVEASIPLKAWIVLEIQDKDGEALHYKFWPFNWVKYDWNSSAKRTISIPTGVVPVESKRVVCYLWNIRKLPLKMKAHSFRMYYLEGSGAGEALPVVP